MNLCTTTIKAESKVSVYNYLPKIGKENLIRQILSGLQKKQKFISSMFFYDETGSELFKAITRLPEYYLTRTEMRLITEAGKQLGGQLSDMDIVELGSGDCSKISIILRSIDEQARHSIRYIPVDVSHSAVQESAECLSSKFPEITIHGLVAIFFSQLNLIPNSNKRLLCFFGSTIGNLSHLQANRLIRDIGQIMNRGDHFFLGVDMVKDVNVLEAAYNDDQGVTAAFNRNIINVVNDLAGISLDPEAFEHVAFYNNKESRIEMHLRACCSMKALCPHLKDPIYIEEGEMIHTENSHKFTNADIEYFGMQSGLTPMQRWTDPNQWFTFVQFVK